RRPQGDDRLPRPLPARHPRPLPGARPAHDPLGGDRARYHQELGSFERPMTALLRAWGADFDPDQFFAESPLKPSRLYRKGEPLYPNSQPNGPRHEQSGVNLVASEADLHEFSRQIEEATTFLEDHKSELARLRQQPDIEGITLDFGIAWRDV